MTTKLSIRGILASEAISNENLAMLLFPDVKFPKSALRRLIALPETTSLEQAIKIAEHLSIPVETLIDNSYIYEMLKGEHVQMAQYKSKFAFIPISMPSIIVLVKNYKDCTLQNIDFDIIELDSTMDHDDIRQKLLSLIK